MVSFAAITPCVASQRVFIVVSVYFLYRLSPETFWIYRRMVWDAAIHGHEPLYTENFQ
jgi:hypothetical protein